MGEKRQERPSEGKGRPPSVFDQTFLTGVSGVTEVLLPRNGQQRIDVDAATIGDCIDPPLSEQGRLQARLLGEALSLKPIDAVFASNLRRADETAAEIARHQEVAVEHVEDLREAEGVRDLPPQKTAPEVRRQELLAAGRRR